MDVYYFEPEKLVYSIWSLNKWIPAIWSDKLMAEEGIAFEKHLALYELESRHGVARSRMQTAPSAKQFTHYIAGLQCIL